MKAAASPHDRRMDRGRLAQASLGAATCGALAASCLLKRVILAVSHDDTETYHTSRPTSNYGEQSPKRFHAGGVLLCRPAKNGPAAECTSVRRHGT